MIDMHSHVLPMVDDGSASWEETEEMFRRMSLLGFTQIVATSHWAVGMPDVAAEIIMQARTLAAKSQIELSIARECRIHQNLLEHVRQTPQCRIDGGNVVLVELPWGKLPVYTVPVISGLLRNGYRPILAHVARHPELWEENSPLSSITAMGVPLQVNLSTIGGDHGRGAQERALSLLEAGRISLVASDIHSASAIDESVARPLRLLEGIIGPEASRVLTTYNPRALLESRPLIDLSDGTVEYSFDSSIVKSRGLLSRMAKRLSFGRR